MNVLIIPEDFRNDQYILKPLFSRLFRSFVSRRVHVDVCRDPLLGGVGEALKSGRIEEVVRKHRGMTDIFILCIDRDGDANRRQSLDRLESEFNNGQTFLAANAWEEIETYLGPRGSEFAHSLEVEDRASRSTSQGTVLRAACRPAQFIGQTR